MDRETVSVLRVINRGWSSNIIQLIIIELHVIATVYYRQISIVAGISESQNFLEILLISVCHHGYRLWPW